jgi:hypothetical protein
MLTSLFPFENECFISNPASKFGKVNEVCFALTVFAVTCLFIWSIIKKIWRNLLCIFYSSMCRIACFRILPCLFRLFRVGAHMWEGCIKSAGFFFKFVERLFFNWNFQYWFSRFFFIVVCKNLFHIVADVSLASKGNSIRARTKGRTVLAYHIDPPSMYYLLI